MSVKKLSSEFVKTAPGRTVIAAHDPATAHITSVTGRRIVQLVQDIATLYCSESNGQNPFIPHTELRQAKKWEDYQISVHLKLAAHAPSHAAADAMYQERTLASGVRALTADMAVLGTPDVRCRDKARFSLLDFPTINDVTETCESLLQSPDCPGTGEEKAALRTCLKELVKGAILERAREGFETPNYGYLH